MLPSQAQVLLTPNFVFPLMKVESSSQHVPHAIGQAARTFGLTQLLARLPALKPIHAQLLPLAFLNVLSVLHSNVVGATVGLLVGALVGLDVTFLVGAVLIVGETDGTPVGVEEGAKLRVGGEVLGLEDTVGFPLGWTLGSFVGGSETVGAADGLTLGIFVGGSDIVGFPDG